MPFENSPSLKEFAHGVPPTPPDSSRGHRRARVLIIALSAIIAVLLGINLFARWEIAAFGGSGTVIGRVIDAGGQPAVADIFIERTDLATRSDTNGRFVVQRVPAGEYLLAVASDDLAVEYPIIAVAGAEVDIGTVQVQTTAVALP